jgi:hypothetical protein
MPACAQAWNRDAALDLAGARAQLRQLTRSLPVEELRMNRSLILASAVSLLLAAGSLRAAEPAPAPAEAEDPANAVAASEADTRSARLDRFCPDATASRIKRQRGSCSSPGRVYTRDDLDRTGATTAGEALSKLDPSIGRGF